jgi:hypothetical protein
MNKTLLVVAAGVLLSWTLVSGESITASSDPFTFPSIAGVKNSLAAFDHVYFKCSGVSQKSRTVAFTWSVPDQVTSDNGLITVYSLLGKTIKTLRLESRRGTEAWKPSKSERASMGIYFARLTFGSFVQNIKLVINK